MNKFKLDVLKREFPFLKEILSDKKHTEINFIRIARADEEMLKSIPEEYYWDGSAGETSNWDRISFVLKNGTVQMNCVRTKGVAGSNYAHEGTREWEGETVLEALSEIENPDDIQYIVWEKKIFSDWRGQDRTRTYEVTIYKTPKNESLSDILERAKKKAMMEVMAETNF